MMHKNTLFALTMAAWGLEAAVSSDIPFNRVIPAFTDPSCDIVHEQPICFLFAHGLGGNKNNVNYYHRHSIVKNPFFSFNFPDAAHGVVNLKETSLAQENEIAAFKQAFDEVCTDFQTKLGTVPKVVLTGVSRGASSIITFMATHNPENVCALVIESPFDAIHSVITGMLKRVGLSKSEGLHKLGHKIIGKIHAKYNRFAPTPLDMVSQITNKELPILIICSKKDELIPWSSSCRLFEEFKKHDFKNVHILISSHGKHVKILEGRYAHLYKEAVNEFYKRYLNI